MKKQLLLVGLLALGLGLTFGVPFAFDEGKQIGRMEAEAEFKAREKAAEKGRSEAMDAAKLRAIDEAKKAKAKENKAKGAAIRPE